MTTVRVSKYVLNMLLILVLLAIPMRAVDSASTQPAAFRYANGVVLAPNSSLPVFRVNTLAVTGPGTFDLSVNLTGVSRGANETPRPDTYRGHPRFSILNENNHTTLEQFGATGGFYAYNPERAFNTSGKLPDPPPTLVASDARRMACLFLLNNQNLVTKTSNLQIPGLTLESCDVTDPPYRVSTETLNGQDSIPGSSPDTPVRLRLQVTVPININIGVGAPMLIPLGGPGGHISMIFDDTSPNSMNPSLDDSVKGLQALAMPAFGRTFDPVKLVPAIDPALAKAQVLDRVKSAYPGAKNIMVPDPILEYFVTEAGVPQETMEPDLLFSGITLDIDGQTLTLKELIVPAADSGPGGLGPTVTINLPKNGASTRPGLPIHLEGTISDGTAPYSYDWQLDDGTSLMAAPGTAGTAGSLPPLSVVLTKPDMKDSLGTQVIHLVVTDNDGVVREAVVTLKTPQTYLPTLGKWIPASGDANPLKAFMPSSVSGIASPQNTTANYSFGVEYGSDYPPYGPGGSDLGGVPPDANGLSSGLMGLGWPRIFNWYNINAWERDWRDITLGGLDSTYGVDRTDFVYYSGHGSDGTLYMPNNSHDSSWVDATKARFQRARWVFFSSCLTLRAQAAPGTEPIRRWFNSFQGAHILLGFNSLMADIAYGPPLVDNLRMPTFPFIGEIPWLQRTIAQAWVQTAFQTNAGKPAYLWATGAGVNPIGDKLPKPGDPLKPRPFPANWFYWVWWNT